MQKTSLYEEHLKLGGKIVDFGGWALPVQFSGIQKEHKAVREAAGIFDVSHMGEVFVRGPEALKFTNYIITNDIEKISNGRALYTVLCKEDGGIIDDLIVYRISDTELLFCVNAANNEKDFSWIQKQSDNFEVQVTNESNEYAQIALQGPKAQNILQPLVKEDLASLRAFRFLQADLDGTNCIIARTGYTGEDGFELYIAANEGPKVWQSLLKHGKEFGIEPCGLGARDTLRLEAALALYGNDLDEDTNPFEANLGWVVKLSKENFIGKDALQTIHANGPKRKLVGLKLQGRGIARQGYLVKDAAGKEIGQVSSGSLSPTLGYPIALAYVNSTLPQGAEVIVKIRNNDFPATVVPIPFYKRKA